MYSIIYGDPPWAYKDKASSGKRGAAHKYDVMSLDRIKAMKVDQIAAKDAVLFLWGTFPLYDQAIETIRSWGFTYKTAAFIWVKLNKVADTEFMGMGNWTRANPEPCLIGVRGKPKRISAKVRSLVWEIEQRPPEVVTAHLRRHSQKPDQVRDRIVELMGDLPRIELFATQQFKGWDSWGNELPGYSRDSEISRVLLG